MDVEEGSLVFKLFSPDAASGQQLAGQSWSEELKEKLQQFVHLLGTFV